MQEVLRQTVSACNELLRHFWAQFPLNTSKRVGSSFRGVVSHSHRMVTIKVLLVTGYSKTGAVVLCRKQGRWI